MQKGDTVWISKYALTKGLIESRFDCVGFSGSGIYTDHGYCNDSEWHATLEEAHAKAKAMATRKLKSLEKQASKLKAIVENGAKVTT